MRKPRCWPTRSSSSREEGLPGASDKKCTFPLCSARICAILRADASSVFNRRVNGQDSEEENRDREEWEEEDERTQTKRRVHEAGDAEPRPGRGHRRQSGAADRGHQEAVGL